MFTGITRGTFAVVSAKRDAGLLRYQVELDEELAAGLRAGASVAIDGVCQTVVSVDGVKVTFEAIQETLDKTTLSELTEGRRVSVERSLRAGDEIGGHEVAGHVVGTARVESVQREGHEVRMTLACPSDWMKYIFAKGFIAVDGSSLTVGEVDPAGRFTIHLIPETIRLTNFGGREVGDRVNLELDARTVAIVDTVERTLQRHRTSPPRE